MKESNFEVSNTTLSSEWIRDSIWTHNWHCNNCHDTRNTVKDGRLGRYCANCGARMRNPQYVTTSYDYD